MRTLASICIYLLSFAWLCGKGSSYGFPLSQQVFQGMLSSQAWNSDRVGRTWFPPHPLGMGGGCWPAGNRCPCVSCSVAVPGEEQACPAHYIEREDIPVSAQTHWEAWGTPGPAWARAGQQGAAEAEEDCGAPAFQTRGFLDPACFQKREPSFWRVSQDSYQRSEPPEAKVPPGPPAKGSKMTIWVP